MKTAIIFLALVALALSSTSFVELSGFKTADQLLEDVHSDSANVYAITFFRRDDTNYELTQSNKKLLDKLNKKAIDLRRERN